MKQQVRIKIVFSLFILSALGALIVLVKDRSWTTSSETKLQLSTDSASLSKIKILNRTSTLLLSKENDQWSVNNTFEVRPTILNLLFVALTKAEIKRAVAQENKSAIRSLLIKEGIQVTVESGGLVKEFFLSSNENDVNSSYYLEKGSEEPFVIFVPSFNGDMTSIFKMDEANWRSRELFSSSPMSLQKITVSYPSFKQHNIELTWNPDNSFSIPMVKKVDSSKVITYLSQFEYVGVDAYVYENKEERIAALASKSPQAIIQVTDLRPNASHTLKIYGESIEPKGIYAVVEPQQELVIMKPETLFRILVRKEFFEKK